MVLKLQTKEEIISTLGPFLKPSCCQFCKNLPINNYSVDLVIDRDQSMLMIHAKRKLYKCCFKNYIW